MGFKKPKFNLINWIKKRWKRLWCKHNWKTKEKTFNTNNVGFIYFDSKRCIKCGKIKQILIKG